MTVFIQKVNNDTFIYPVNIEDDDAMEDIKTTLKQILKCQQSLIRLLEIVENAIKGWLCCVLSFILTHTVYSQCRWPLCSKSV